MSSTSRRMNVSTAMNTGSNGARGSFEGGSWAMMCMSFLTRSGQLGAVRGHGPPPSTSSLSPRWPVRQGSKSPSGPRRTPGHTLSTRMWTGPMSAVLRQLPPMTTHDHLLHPKHYEWDRAGGGPVHHLGHLKLAQDFTFRGVFDSE